MRVNSKQNGNSFVSLGSTCEICHVLRETGLRTVAYPFDWITTIDAPGFLNILREDFKHFLDTSCLQPVNKDPFPLLNVYYKTEFLHDGRFNKEILDTSMADFQSKYERRIQRFRDIANHKGKVVFLRHAYKYSLTDPNRVFFCEDNLEITVQWSCSIFCKTSFPPP